MNSEKAKALAWTLALVIFLVVVIYSRVDWLGLMITGAILIWYGFVGNTLLGKSGSRN
jgi:hypothetical protein